MAGIQIAIIPVNISFPPCDLNSSSRISAVSFIHIGPFTAMYLFPESGKNCETPARHCVSVKDSRPLCVFFQILLPLNLTHIIQRQYQPLYLVLVHESFSNANLTLALTVALALTVTLAIQRQSQPLYLVPVDESWP